MNSEPSEIALNSFLLDAWERHENIAMHFNDLILKVRLQALGALAAVVTVGGVLLKTVPPERHLPWGLVTSVFAVLLALWIAIWLLDFRYYNRLLLGAVDSLLALENAINSGAKIDFNMSHKIEDAVHGKAPTHREEGTLTGPLLFYSIVTVVLIVGIAYSGASFFC
jgi:hypothetical protein